MNKINNLTPYNNNNNNCYFINIYIYTWRILLFFIFIIINIYIVYRVIFLKILGNSNSIEIISFSGVAATEKNGSMFHGRESHG